MTVNLLLFTFVLITLTINSSSDQYQIKPTGTNVFAKLDYDKVVAYKYNGENGIEIINKENGQLASKIKTRVVLDESKAINITNYLCDKSSYGGDIAACFDPHFGLVFYKINKPVAYLSICLDCNYLVASVRISGSENGFSVKGISSILAFENQIGF